MSRMVTSVHQVEDQEVMDMGTLVLECQLIWVNNISLLSSDLDLILIQITSIIASLIRNIIISSNVKILNFLQLANFPIRRIKISVKYFMFVVCCVSKSNSYGRIEWFCGIDIKYFFPFKTSPPLWKVDIFGKFYCK